MKFTFCTFKQTHLTMIKKNCIHKKWLKIYLKCCFSLYLFISCSYLDYLFPYKKKKQFACFPTTKCNYNLHF